MQTVFAQDCYSLYMINENNNLTKSITVIYSITSSTRKLFNVLLWGPLSYFFELKMCTEKKIMQIYLRFFGFHEYFNRSQAVNTQYKFSIKKLLINLVLYFKLQVLNILKFITTKYITCFRYFDKFCENVNFDYTYKKICDFITFNIF